MSIDSPKTTTVVNEPPKAIEKKVIVASKNKVDKTAQKINYWAFFGLMFFTIGVIATTIATCGLNQIIFHATVATLDTVLGSGAILLTIGSIFITKALIDKNKKINKSRHIYIFQKKLVLLELQTFLSELQKVLSELQIKKIGRASCRERV